MSDAEADRIARRIRRRQAEWAQLPEPLSLQELDDALVYARNVGAPAWLIRLLERARCDGTAER